MTRKDYVLIANILKRVGDIDGRTIQPASWTIYTVARELSVVLLADNPNFDQEKFLKACGVK